MGGSGCTHTATPHWDLRTFTGTVSVVGTRQKALTCTDVAAGAREEIVAGRYMVKFALDRAASQRRIAANAQKLPTTSRPLKLVFAVTSTTHEVVRTLSPNADGQGCTETTRDGQGCTETTRGCDKSAKTTKTDSLDVFVRARRVVQETPGDFIAKAFLECAETPQMTSLLLDDPLEGKFMSEPSRLSAFRHRSTTVTHGRDHQIGDGATSIDVSGRVSYGRSIRACTRYPLAKPRCRSARG
jgi:hypothetical protein